MPSGDSRRPPLPGPLGRLASGLYALAVRTCPDGGTGETPKVMHVVRSQLRLQAKPCIAMRGYGSTRGESDEATEYRREFPITPVIAQADRTHGLLSLFAQQHEMNEPGSTHIVLDDGFQHRQIARDTDIVLIDATQDPFSDKLLPAGWLREPVLSLRRATFVVLTHAEAVTGDSVLSLARRVSAIRPDITVAVARHSWDGFLQRQGEADAELPLDALRGRPLFAVCAIGRPDPFLAQVRRAGDDRDSLVLRDHDPYSANTALSIAAKARACGAKAIITTNKDWSKLRRFPDTFWPCPIIRPRLTLTFDRGEDDLYAHIAFAERRSARRDSDP